MDVPPVGKSNDQIYLKFEREECVGNVYVNLVTFPDNNLLAAIQDLRNSLVCFQQAVSPFTPIVPCADWRNMCFCKWRHCVLALVFLSGVLV